MPDNNEKPHKIWIMYRKAKDIINNCLMTVDNKKFITANNEEFLVKEA